MKKEKIYVIASGNQAPYGIGEIIAVFPNTAAGLKKACQHAATWHNPADVQLYGEFLPLEKIYLEG